VWSAGGLNAGDDAGYFFLFTHNLGG
jgi:hypothetical protein